MGDQVYSREVVIWALEQASGEAFRGRKNSGFDAKVLIAICAHADNTGTYAWVGQTKIAAIVYGIDPHEVTDSHLRSVRRSIAFLIEQGALQVRRRAHMVSSGRSVNGYDLGFARIEIVQGEVVEESA